MVQHVLPKRRGQIQQGAIAMVTLARLTGADQLLPVALAECCELGADVVNGFEREDGTRDHLAPEDLGRCIKATRNLVEARLYAMEHTVRPAVYEGCEEGCIHDINMFRDRVLGGTIPGLCTTQFWRSYASLLTDEFPDVCKRCAEEFSEEELVQQRSIFRRLPLTAGGRSQGRLGMVRRKDRVPGSGHLASWYSEMTLGREWSLLPWQKQQQMYAFSAALSRSAVLYPLDRVVQWQSMLCYSAFHATCQGSVVVHV
ncbi:hypothetical protein OH76DRAFT_614875 [Lentinus brumalis]|uniref:Uncharacterized protein n=1 Tax=Lentinus brumalis TaxID=2498619 RepID=A0A371D8T7_9APHY|nr:hypothetical protein OH76DRAFT_614875 [Polyporus brumalis]